MQHIKYIGHDFDENGFLVETFEYKGRRDSESQDLSKVALLALLKG